MRQWFGHQWGRLYRASSSQQFHDGPSDAAPGATDEDLHVINTVAAVSAINEGHVWPLIGEEFDLPQSFGQRMTVVGAQRQAKLDLQIRIDSLTTKTHLRGAAHKANASSLIQTVSSPRRRRPSSY
jgi:hypothetical protein